MCARLQFYLSKCTCTCMHVCVRTHECMCACAHMCAHMFARAFKVCAYRVCVGFSCACTDCGRARLPAHREKRSVSDAAYAPTVVTSSPPQRRVPAAAAGREKRCGEGEVCGNSGHRISVWAQVKVRASQLDTSIR